MNNLHGAAASLMMDILTTSAVMTVAKEGFWRYVGVSRTLSTTYLRPVPEDTEIEVISEVLQIGKRMCTIRGEIRRVSDGVLCVVGEHGESACYLVKLLRLMLSVGLYWPCKWTD